MQLPPASKPVPPPVLPKPAAVPLASPEKQPFQTRLQTFQSHGSSKFRSAIILCLFSVSPKEQREEKHNNNDNYHISPLDDHEFDDE
jgi:hypothetical protein